MTNKDSHLESVFFLICLSDFDFLMFRIDIGQAHGYLEL